MTLTTSINGQEYTVELNLPENLDAARESLGDELVYEFFIRSAKSQARSRIRQLAKGSDDDPDSGLGPKKVAASFKDWQPVLGQQGLSDEEKAERLIAKMDTSQREELLKLLQK